MQKAFGVAAVGLFAAAGYSQTFTFTPLPLSAAASVSKDGLIVGGSVSGAIPQAAIWSQVGGLVMIPIEPGAIQSGITEIDPHGAILGGSTMFVQAGNNVSRAGISIDAGMLTSLSNGGMYVNGLSDDSDGVACTYGSESISHWYGRYVRRSTGQINNFANSAGSTINYSYSQGIDAAGHRAVGWAERSGIRRAVYWNIPLSGNADIKAVEIAGVLGNNLTYAADISDDGQIILGYGGASPQRLFLYRVDNGSLQQLGVAPDGRFSIAAALSGNAKVAVGSTTSGNALFWSWQSGTVFLKDYLATLGVDTAGWTMSYAFDVSADGKTIVGVGKNPSNQSQGWMVTLDFCQSDFNHSGFVDIEDFDAFVHAFEGGSENADFDDSGFVDLEDFDSFVHAFENGC